MKTFTPKESLLWKILFSTSIAVTAVFAVTGWMVQRYAASVNRHSIEEEIRTSLQAYESLWSARVHNLTAISRIMSTMSDVRAAFMTRDQATIRDTAEQLWSTVSEADARFLVLDPTGELIASLGGSPQFAIDASLMQSARLKFPDQVTGYLRRGPHLYYVVLTPVYVETANERALLNVLLIALRIDNKLADELKASTHGSDFAFVSSNDVNATTLAGITAIELTGGTSVQGHVRRVKLRGENYLLLGTELRDTSGALTGRLFIIRSFAGPTEVLSELRRNVAGFWILGILVAVGLTYLLARRVLKPVKDLDRAAEEVIRRNYDCRVPVETDDELGRLAMTFNQMCDSIRSAREELIRQEQLSTIARLSGSIVHDLRNPLAAIYGGAEMLVDAELSSEQQRRLAANIYQSSRRIQELLQELLDVSRAQTKPSEMCRLTDIALAARDALTQPADLNAVSIEIDIPENIHVVVSRDRLERVYINLIDNAIDVMPDGGHIDIRGYAQDSRAVVVVEDTGPGIPDEAWATLFRPFASFKKNGLGLGLALSREVLLDNGGDLWAERKSTPGARFVMSLPLAPPPPAVTAEAFRDQQSATSS
ncbi:MAG TPA: ATP-binding protein [Bryobacteraceae bacterium]|nr:ATP-binding protein [Bryobacteraceae bacterium]